MQNASQSSTCNNDGESNEFFEEQMDHQYEIVGYDDVKLKRSQTVNWLRMLQNTYNWRNI